MINVRKLIKKALAKTIAAATVATSALFVLGPVKVSALKAYMYELSESSNHVVEFACNKKAVLGHRILRNGTPPVILMFDLYEQSLKKFREDVDAIIAKNSALLMKGRLGILASWEGLERLIVFKPEPEDDDLVSGMTAIFANAFNDVLSRINEGNSDRAKYYGAPGQYDFTTNMTVFDADALYFITRAVQPASSTHPAQTSQVVQSASATHPTRTSRAIQSDSDTRPAHAASSSTAHKTPSSAIRAGFSLAPHPTSSSTAHKTSSSAIRAGFPLAPHPTSSSTAHKTPSSVIRAGFPLAPHPTSSSIAKADSLTGKS